MKQCAKMYQVWRYSNGGYQLKEFEFLSDLVESLSGLYTDNFYITKRVNILMKEVLE